MPPRDTGNSLDSHTPPHSLALVSDFISLTFISSFVAGADNSTFLIQPENCQ